MKDKLRKQKESKHKKSRQTTHTQENNEQTTAKPTNTDVDDNDIMMVKQMMLMKHFDDDGAKGTDDTYYGDGINVTFETSNEEFLVKSLLFCNFFCTSYQDETYKQSTQKINTLI